MSGQQILRTGLLKNVVHPGASALNRLVDMGFARDAAELALIDRSFQSAIDALTRAARHSEAELVPAY